MIIRKMFKFENAHIVRNCTTRRCRENLHGHSYRVEVLLESDYLDHGQMVYDFGLMKQTIRETIDSFDHAITLWSGDDPAYVRTMQAHSQRWIVLPVNPSAEQFSRVFFRAIERLLSLTRMQNGERNVQLHSIIVHETDTGYAQCFADDAHNEQMGIIALEAIEFSDAIRDEWSDPQLWDKLIARTPIVPATSV